MKKKELITYSADDFIVNKKSFAEFIKLYIEEYGKDPNCSTCRFNSTFNRWKLKNAKNNKKRKKMAKTKNTFKLKNPNGVYRIPFTTKIINSNSSDEDVLEYINQENGKYKEDREKNFLTLPSEATKAKKGDKKVTVKAKSKTDK